MQYGTHARRRTQMDRRSFSPKYKPLLEEQESVSSETSLRSEENGGSSVGQGGKREYEERVVILSDHDNKGGSGDADSGISLTEMAGEDHGQSGDKHTKFNFTKPESLLLLVVQIVIPFFFAGFGMMAAGLLLDAVQVSNSRLGACGVV